MRRLGGENFQVTPQEIWQMIREDDGESSELRVCRRVSGDIALMGRHWNSGGQVSARHHDAGVRVRRSQFRHKGVYLLACSGCGDFPQPGCSGMWAAKDWDQMPMTMSGICSLA